MPAEFALPRAPDPGLREAGARPLRPRAFAALALHLTARQLKSSHHLTLLGWGWPVARQLAQLAVLVFIFGKVLDLDVDNYPAFVFVGLMAWTWFSGAVSGAATSVLSQRHLVMQPRLPSSVLPIVAVLMPLVDVLFALPVLVLVLAVSTGLDWGLLACPLLLVVQLALVAGLGWLVAGVSVFLRDVPNLVGVALMILFYLTPVFYDRELVPERFCSARPGRGSAGSAWWPRRASCCWCSVSGSSPASPRASPTTSDPWPSASASRRYGRRTHAGGPGRCARRSTGGCRGCWPAASTAGSCVTCRSRWVAESSPASSGSTEPASRRCS